MSTMTKMIVGAALVGSAAAHDFKQCGSTDDLHVASVTLNPDPVKAGGNLAATITASPDKDITGGKVNLKVSAFGVTVLTKEFDICSLTTCPIAKGKTSNLAVNYPIPSAAPALTAQAEFDVTDSSGGALDCIKMDVKVVKSQQLFGAPKGLTEENHQFLFNQWVKQYGKQYEMHEFFGRYNQFKENMESILAHESQGHDWSQAMNQFGDLSKDEFRDQYTGYHSVQNKLMRSKNYADLSGVKAADSVDWRTKGAVSPVKNQGQCGSCWAFSTVGSIEGANEIATGNLQQFSEQELVDCAGSEGNQGCNGGLMDNGFKWVEKNGLCKENDYTPYSASDGTCTKSSCKSAVSLSGFKDVTSGSESDLAKALTINPVSIAIEADQSGFQFYSGGVFSGSCGKQLDHGVLAVGYGTMNSKDYWIVKNSWGATWGDSGYIMIERGSDKCGIADAASYPVVGN